MAFLVLLMRLAFPLTSFAQYTWKLSKDKNGIKVFESNTQNSNLKSIKVECNMDGNVPQLISALNDVSYYKNWVYRTRKSYILKKISPLEFYYYEETSAPGLF